MDPGWLLIVSLRADVHQVVWRGASEAQCTLELKHWVTRALQWQYRQPILLPRILAACEQDTGAFPPNPIESLKWTPPR